MEQAAFPIRETADEEAAQIALGAVEGVAGEPVVATPAVHAADPANP
ncbi:MAG: hypothetical protein P4L10_15015 [Acidobacteriaceae bacterium]|nr:hypothetical protein [Acidobacteriaceae bacterium]